MSVNNKLKEGYILTYKGIDYDITQYVCKHPGGPQFIINMKHEKKDITQYFKAIHSQQAQKILMSFKQVGKNQVSKQSKKYLKLYQRVKHLYQPNWAKECCYIIFTVIILLMARFTKYAIVSIFCFAIAQVMSCWIGHSMNHSRNRTLYKIGSIVGPLLAGISVSWWSYKHNMHHIFTNSIKYDQDIDHDNYPMFYPFLFVKWRFDALVFSLRDFNILELICMFVHYYFLSRQKIIYFFVGILLAGFFSTYLFLGNHQREKRYRYQIRDDFIQHQITTCRNYLYEGFFWLILMGGMQYHTEHHLFPQIPFYQLPQAKKIIAEELKVMGKQVSYGAIL